MPILSNIIALNKSASDEQTHIHLFVQEHSGNYSESFKQLSVVCKVTPEAILNVSCILLRARREHIGYDVNKMEEKVDRPVL